MIEFQDMVTMFVAKTVGYLRILGINQSMDNLMMITCTLSWILCNPPNSDHTYFTATI